MLKNNDLHFTIPALDIQIASFSEIQGSSVQERFTKTVGRQCWFDVQNPIFHIAIA